MFRRSIAPAASLAALLLLSPPSFSLSSSTIALTFPLATDAKLTVPGTKPVKSSYGGSTFQFDVTGANCTLSDSVQGGFFGPVHPVGARGFTVTPDQGSTIAFQNNLVGQIMSAAHATSVTVTKFTFKVKGSVDKTGAILTLRRKALLKGAAVIGGKRYTGSVVESDTMTGQGM